MRLRSIVNWTLLCLNALLCAILLFILLVHLGWIHSGPFVHLNETDQAILNQDVYWAKGPFVFLVDKDFPRNESFTLFQQDKQLSVSTKDLCAWLKPKEWNYISVVINPDFSISCDYSIAGGKAFVHELMLSHRKNGLRESLTDFNADGIFDRRSTTGEDIHENHGYVWYHGIWREIMGGEKGPNQDEYDEQLLDGTRVSFDVKSGQWLSSTEKPAADNDKGAHENKQEKPVP